MSSNVGHSHSRILMSDKETFLQSFHVYRLLVYSKLWDKVTGSLSVKCNALQNITDCKIQNRRTSCIQEHSIGEKRGLITLLQVSAYRKHLFSATKKGFAKLFFISNTAFWIVFVCTWRFNTLKHNIKHLYTLILSYVLFSDHPALKRRDFVMINSEQQSTVVHFQRGRTLLQCYYWF